MNPAAATSTVTSLNGIGGPGWPASERLDLPLGACLVDSEGRISAADPVVAAWLASGPEAAGGGPWPLKSLTPDGRFDEPLRRCSAGEQPPPVVIWLPAAGCAAAPISVQFTRLDGPLGPQILLSFHGSPREAAPLVLDALTQLPDRRALADRAAAWRLSNSETACFAVLFLDLDDFKSVNDRYGHAVGDAVLHTLASRWANCIREGDLATRYGGDEFVLLIRGAATADEVEPVLRRLANAAQTPVVVDEVVLQLSATIGWSTPTSSDWTIEALVAAADADMYARKRRMLR